MIAVIFEVEPAPQQREQYLALAADLAPRLALIDGFISIERYASLTRPDCILSLSLWRDEPAVMRWRQLETHRAAQACGRAGLFRHYQLRVAHVVRSYAMDDRREAPVDARLVHG